MPALKHDILIEKGATFRLSLLYKDSAGSPVNLTGWNARMKTRLTYDGPEIASLTVDSTTAPGGITMGGTAGTMVITISAANTSAVTEKGRGVYDLEIYDTSSPVQVERIIEGKAILSEEATK